jgi:hypothetical protein
MQVVYCNSAGLISNIFRVVLHTEIKSVEPLWRCYYSSIQEDPEWGPSAVLSIVVKIRISAFAGSLTRYPVIFLTQILRLKIIFHLQSP